MGFCAIAVMLVIFYHSGAPVPGGLGVLIFLCPKRILDYLAASQGVVAPRQYFPARLLCQAYSPHLSSFLRLCDGRSLILMLTIHKAVDWASIRGVCYSTPTTTTRAIPGRPQHDAQPHVVASNRRAVLFVVALHCRLLTAKELWSCEILDGWDRSHMVLSPRSHFRTSYLSRVYLRGF